MKPNRMTQPRFFVPLLFVATAISATVPARAAFINFEGYPDSTILSNQYQASGVLFANAAIITAQYSLDEQDFPPHSGVNVAIDVGGPMVLGFTTPIVELSGYFTYTEQLTLTAFDDMQDPIPALTTMSDFTSNYVSAFDPAEDNTPNEFIEIGDGTTPISFIRIAGDPNGYSFVVDDITTTPTAPEPGTFPLGAGLIGLSLALRGRRRVFALFGRGAALLSRGGGLLRPGHGMRSAAMLGVLLIFASAGFAQTITAALAPGGIVPNTATPVTITATFSVAPIPTGVLLQQINSSGAITNPNLGTLTMVNATTFAITTPFTLASGSSLLQVSAGFKGQILRVVSNPITVFAIPAASNLTVSFTGNISILQDMNGSAPLVANPVYVDNPAVSSPVAYAAGNTMKADLTFTLNPVPAAPIPNVTITGTITRGPMGPATFSLVNVTLPAAATASVTGTAANAPLQANLVQYLSSAAPMTIQWSYTVGGMNTVIGTSSNPLYVTLANPLSAAVFQSDLKFATSSPGAVNAAQALANTWSLFSTGGGAPGPQNITTWDGRLLSYYPTGTGFTGCATSERGLLTSPTGAGQCGSFAYLLIGSLAANGIRSTFVTVVPKYTITVPPAGVTADEGFLVNNWMYAAAGTSGDADYPYTLTFNPAAGGIDMVPSQPGGIYGDLTSIAGIPGQNSPTPSEKGFARHFIVLPAAPLNGTYYDPSYGVTYAGPNDFEIKAVAGYIKPQTAIMIAVAPNIFYDRKPNPGGVQLMNIEFSN